MPGLVDGWQVASSDAGAYAAPPGNELDWRAASVPGTVAGALAADGAVDAAGLSAIDEADWWFRCSFAAEAVEPGERVLLELDGVATLWELFLNGERIGGGSSMFVAESFEVGARLDEHNDLALCCRALAPLLELRRKPRARWRPRIAAGNLRFHRTMLQGRARGFAPGPPAIGPWRGIALSRHRGAHATKVRWRPRLERDDGVLAVSATLTGGAAVASVELGGLEAELASAGDGVFEGELRIPGVERWWPHTHGEPVLHEARLKTGDIELARRRIGFRTLSFADDFEGDGLDLHVNGVPVFARGALWNCIDPVGLAPSEEALRHALLTARDAGMNMLRLAGTSAYESPAFHALCDELGILVWQDFMFANFDYPVEDEQFRDLVEVEARQVMDRLGGSPSLAVLCGNSEVEQQAAMLGLAPGTGRGALFGELLPSIVGRSGIDAAWVPSAPCGGPLPFTPSAGVSNYFGVGGYRRPLSDARAAGVRFASECLAFANPPDGLAMNDIGVPRDAGSEWDFADVRDHYLEQLYGVDATQLAAGDPEHYAALSRAVPGEVMAEVFGEWRREGSPCRGALVLWYRDVIPGAGWGVVARDGALKEPWHHLRRALAPVAVWTTDEGLGGIDVHAANDRPRELDARLRVALYRDLEHVVEDVERPLTLAAHGSFTASVEGLIGGFRDVGWAYRFGPPAQDAVVASLYGADDGRLLSQSVRFPVGRPSARESADELGLTAALGPGPALTLTTRRLVHGVRLDIPGFVPEDDAFSLEPGRERTVALDGPGRPAGGRLTALNLRGEIQI